MNDAAWIALLEAAVAGLEKAPTPALLRQVTQTLYMRFPQRQPTTLSTELFPRAGAIAERILALVLGKKVEDDGFAAETCTRALCVTTDDPGRVATVLSATTVEPLTASATQWIASLSTTLAQRSPTALAWIADRMPPEGNGHSWYPIHSALPHLPLTAAGIRALGAVLAADARINPADHWSFGENKELIVKPRYTETPLVVAGHPAKLLSDSKSTRHLEHGAEREISDALRRAAKAIASGDVAVEALADTSWPLAFWREVLDEASANPTFGDQIWDLACSDDLMRKAPTAAVKFALGVLSRGGDHAERLTKLMSDRPEEFRALYFCASEEQLTDAELRRRASEMREGKPPYGPDDLEPRVSSGWINRDEEDPHWWLRERGIDVDRNADAIELRVRAEKFWSTYLNDPPPQGEAMSMEPVLAALCDFASKASHDQQLFDVLANGLLRGCRALMLQKDASEGQVGLCQRALATVMPTASASNDDEFAELACLLIYRVDRLTEQHREWLARARGTAEIASFNFRIHLAGLSRLDPAWAWRELVAWGQGEPDEWLVRALWQFRRPRLDDVVALAVAVDERWRVVEKTNVSLGGLLAYCALVNDHPQAQAWLESLTKEQAYRSSVHGVLWWMRQVGWREKGEGIRARSRGWLVRLAQNARARAMQDVAHEIVFHMSALLVRLDSDEAGLDEAAVGEFVRAWAGVVEDLASAVALNAYEVWQLLPLVQVWARHSRGEEAAAALDALTARTASGHATSLLMEMTAIVATVEVVADASLGSRTAVAHVLAAIERLVVTRHPKALKLVDRRLLLARSVG